MMEPVQSVWNTAVDGQHMQAAGSILVLILVPLMGVVGYPLMRRVGLPTSLSGKITIGMLISGVGVLH